MVLKAFELLSELFESADDRIVDHDPRPLAFTPSKKVEEGLVPLLGVAEKLAAEITAEEPDAVPDRPPVTQGRAMPVKGCEVDVRVFFLVALHENEGALKIEEIGKGDLLDVAAILADAVETVAGDLGPAHDDQVIFAGEQDLDLFQELPDGGAFPELHGLVLAGTVVAEHLDDVVP